MQFKKVQLNYEFSDLEPYIDAQTMEVHYTKHHEGYKEKVNNALAGVEKEYETIEDVLKNVKELPADVQTAVINNGGGLSNHNLYFSIISPDGGGEPIGDLAEEIDEVFGSFEDFKDEFQSAALGQFGSGWAWLSLDENGEDLHIGATANQDSPWLEGNKPLIGVDVWEHAYYLRYQNKRGDYVSNFFNVINWEKVEEIYQGYKK